MGKKQLKEARRSQYHKDFKSSAKSNKPKKKIGGRKVK
jgi:hypothetical protein